MAGGFLADVGRSDVGTKTVGFLKDVEAIKGARKTQELTDRAIRVKDIEIEKAQADLAKSQTRVPLAKIYGSMMNVDKEMEKDLNSIAGGLGIDISDGAISQGDLTGDSGIVKHFETKLGRGQLLQATAKRQARAVAEGEKLSQYDSLGRLKDAEGNIIDKLKPEELAQLKAENVQTQASIANGMKTLGGIDPEEAKGDVTAFSKINPKDYTPESIKKFQESSNDFSLLEPTVESLENAIKPLDKFKAEDVLRAQFVKSAGDFEKVRDSVQRVGASAENPSAAGDLALIFNFMKVLDPGSVVRESEFANAQTAQELVERKGLSFGAISRVWSGEKLSEEARSDFVSRANDLFDAQKGQHEKRVSEYTRIAKNRKLDIGNVIVDLKTPTKIPTLDEFLSKAKLANPNSSDEELRAFYENKYGEQ